MNSFLVFTIASANYLAHAKTLMLSVARHHPDTKRFVILADERAEDLGWDDELAQMIEARSLGVPSFEHFAFRYNILEFNTAIKPFAFKALSALAPNRPIVYLDPDILLVSPLREVEEGLASGALAVLTPHLTSPLNDDGRFPDELSILRTGAYNLGFIALGPHPARDALVSWWSSRLTNGAFVDLDSGLFTDQKWIDLVPGLYPDVLVLRHPGYNLAYWNLAHRPVGRATDGNWLAAGEPVRFVHFSGVDPRHPDVFSKNQNRFTLASIGPFKSLFAEYVGLLHANGFADFSRRRYAYSRLRDGTPITDDMRAEFRRLFDVGCPKEAAQPFTLPASELVRPISLRARLARRGLAWYRRLKWSRQIWWLVGQIGPQRMAAIRREVFRSASTSANSPLRDARQAERQRLAISRPDRLEWNPRVNIAGYLTGDFGVAEVARLFVTAAECANVEIAFINIDARSTSRTNQTLANEFTTHNPFPINLLFVNADQTPRVLSELGGDFTRDRYTVGYWFWELAEFPAAWVPAIDCVDEVWVASEFVRAAIERVSNKPVRKVRCPVPAPPSRAYARKEFGLPDDRFVFLFTADLNSYAARKNPLGVVNAFRTAFPRGDESVFLYIKTINANRAQREVDSLLRAIDGDARIKMADRVLPRADVSGLLSVADCYVSLHRSEGLGIGLAEAMSLGKPVIGTGYSGNMEFMEPGNSCVVGYQMIDIKPGEYPFGEDQKWADPDIDHAAYFMRRVANDPAFCSRLGAAARARLQKDFSPKAIGQALAGELIRLQRSF